MSAKNPVLDKTGSHFIDDGYSSHAADGIAKEEVYFYFTAEWRGQPVQVTVSADRYAASCYDEATDTSTNRLSDWRVYARDARYHDPERNGGRGEDTTGTARAALSKLCSPIAEAWLDTPEYKRSFQCAVARMIMRKFRDDYSAQRNVALALDTFKDRLPEVLAEPIRNVLAAREQYDSAQADANADISEYAR